MTEPARIGRWRDSVFVRLMAVMLGLSLVVPVVVAGFFFLVVHPTLDSSASNLIGDYMVHLARSSPDRATAEEAGARLGFDVRYEGPRGEWMTTPSMPGMDDAAATLPSTGEAVYGRGPYLVRNADGSSYLFVWHHDQTLRIVHDRMLVMLLVLLVVILSLGHLLLRRTFMPLRRLAEGVARVTAGDLSAAVVSTRADELGVLTDAFNQMVRQVRNMVRARDQLLLDVSHELRSPLTRMKVALALGDGGSRHDRLEIYVEQMEAMVTELLELERLRHGRGLSLAPHDLPAIVREAAASFADVPPGVELADLPDTLCATIDADKIRGVLGNLLENAAKYALPDSRPTRVSMTTGDEIVIQVADDGPGVPEEDRAMLFEPFFRIDRSRARTTGGYGLGLSLCRRIMEAHGGSIELATSAGRGAVFVLRLPARAEPGATAVPPENS